MPGIDARSSAIYELVEEGSGVEKLATGFTFTEGPIWHPTEQHLLFSRHARRRAAQVHARQRRRRGLRPARKCNGMTYDADLNLLVCEHVTSSLVRERPRRQPRDPRLPLRGQVPEQPERRDRRSSDGTIYFSDPWYGRMPGFGIERERELGFQGVYRIPPGGGQDELVAAAAEGRVRPAERPLLLARRVAAVHQRHAARAHQGLRRERRRHASRTAACSSRASAPASSRRASPTG